MGPTHTRSYWLRYASALAMEMDSSTSIRHTMTASPIWRLKSGMGNHHDTVSWGRPCGQFQGISVRYPPSVSQDGYHPHHAASSIMVPG